MKSEELNLKWLAKDREKYLADEKNTVCITCNTDIA